MPYKDKKKERACWRAYYRKNKEKIRGLALERRVRNGNIIYQLKREASCECGVSFYVCLDFHHVDEKLFNISVSFQDYGVDVLIKEIEKCEILCSNCHRILHYRLKFWASLRKEYK